MSARVLVTNIGELTTNLASGGDPCGTLRDAAVLVEDGRVVWVGAAADAERAPAAPAPDGPVDRETAAARRDRGYSHRSGRAGAVSRGLEVVDVAGRAVLPGFVDSHTHLEFGGDRADEFAARMAGLQYAAGGLRRTVAATRAATDAELRARLAGFVAELHRQGTTTFEVKTGYGLTVADEERSADSRPRSPTR